MHSELTYSQIQDFKGKLKAGTFNLQLELQKLIDLGFEEETAKRLLLNVFKSHKDDLFEEAKEKKETEEKGSLAFTVVMITSLMVALLANNNGFMILLSIVVACFAGYYGYPNKPISAMIGFAFGTIIMPFACAYYLRGRESFINIELLIPVLISFGPAYLVKYLLSKMLYSNED